MDGRQASAHTHAQLQKAAGVPCRRAQVTDRHVKSLKQGPIDNYCIYCKAQNKAQSRLESSTLSYLLHTGAPKLPSQLGRWPMAWHSS